MMIDPSQRHDASCRDHPIHGRGYACCTTKKVRRASTVVHACQVAHARGCPSAANDKRAHPAAAMYFAPVGATLCALRFPASSLVVGHSFRPESPTCLHDLHARTENLTTCSQVVTRRSPAVHTQVASVLGRSLASLCAADLSVVVGRCGATATNAFTPARGELETLA